MYSNYYTMPSNYPNNMSSNYKPNMIDYNQNNERLIGGGFLGPFVLGGITGGLLAPAFYPPRPRPYPYPYPYPYPPYGYYR